MSRALSGQHLSAQTLRYFVGAFDMAAVDAEELWRVFTGAAAGSGLVVVGAGSPPAGTLPPRRHTTVSVHELHRVGPGGLPAEHRSLHVLRATECTDRYPFICDTDAATVEVLRGGVAGPPYRIDERFAAVDIVFDRVLQPGETATLEYRTSFAYPSPPPPCFRRTVTRRVDAMLLRVAFDAARLPERVW